MSFFHFVSRFIPQYMLLLNRPNQCDTSGLGLESAICNAQNSELADKQSHPATAPMTRQIMKPVERDPGQIIQAATSIIRPSSFVNAKVLFIGLPPHLLLGFHASTILSTSIKQNRSTLQGLEWFQWLGDKKTRRRMARERRGA